METFVLLLLTTGSNFCFGQTTITVTQMIENVSHCEDFGSATVTSHIGWPFKLDCKQLARKMQAQYSDNATCSLRRSKGEEVFRIHSNFLDFAYGDVQYPLIDLEKGKEFFMEFNISETVSCGRMEIRVDQMLSNAKNYNCNNLSRDYEETFTRSVGSNLRIPCYVTGVGLYADPSELTYEWWYNCSKTLPQNVQRNPDQPDELIITNMTFANGGEYVCAVRYKDQMRFLLINTLCLTAPSTPSLLMRCPETVRAKPGFDVNLTCYIDYGMKVYALTSPEVRWYNGSNAEQSNFLCPVFFSVFSFFPAPQRVHDTEKIKCSGSQTPAPPNRKCFRYQPPSNVKTGQVRQYNVTLVIKNFQQSDAGEYSVKFKWNRLHDTKTIKVIQDERGHLANASITIGIGVISTGLLVLLAIATYRRRVDILWFHKKHFSPYEKGSKTYDIGLVYHFMRDEMSQESSTLTTNLVENLHAVFEKWNMKVFDENKEHSELQLKVEKIAQTQSECQCIVVVLNEEFSSDEWNILQIHTTLKNIIEKGTNVIFITIPNFMDILTNRQDVNRALKNAMRLGTTIHWSGKLPFGGSFKRHLEYALPKVKNDENSLLYYELR